MKIKDVSKIFQISTFSFDLVLNLFRKFFTFNQTKPNVNKDTSARWGSCSS